MADYGLAALYNRENPYEKRAKAAASILPRSGFAAPLVAAAMGSEMGRAQGWDEEMNQRIQTYLTKQAEVAAMKDRREAIKYQADMLEKSLVIADKVWKGTQGTERDKGQRVIEAVNPLLTSAGLAPLVSYAQDEHGQRSFALVVEKDAQGNILAKRGYISNGQLFTQNGVDAQGQPLFEQAKGDQTTVDEYKKLQDATKKEAPKTRTVQRDGLEITEEFDEATGTWKEVGKGPKWDPRGPAGEKPSFRQFVQVDKDGNVVTDEQGTPLTMTVDTKSQASIEQARRDGFIDPGIAGLNVRTTDPQRRELQRSDGEPGAAPGATPQQAKTPFDVVRKAQQQPAAPATTPQESYGRYTGVPAAAPPAQTPGAPAAPAQPSRAPQPAAPAKPAGKPKPKQDGPSIQDILAAGGKILRSAKDGKDYVIDAQGNVIGTVAK